METKVEHLEIIYKRAMQYCVAQYGSEPNELHLIDGSSFKAIWGNVCRGEYYENEEYFEYNCLTQDLDSVYEERKNKEEQERIEREKERINQEQIRKEREKEQRKEQYLKLKQEFET